MSSKAALVGGGTGPTGPAVVNGLRQRGYEVTILHSGAHEIDEQQDLEHLHGDAFSRDSLTELLEGRSFDLVAAMYGRTRLVADCLAGRCDQFIAIGGAPVYDGYFETETTSGIPVQPVVETARLVGTEPTSAPYPVHTIQKTEQAVLDHHARGSFSASVLRYPTLYGPRVVHNWEWLIIRRILDHRGLIYLPDGGLSLQSRMAWVNAGAAVLCIVDSPEKAAGQTYNAADSQQFALSEWVRRIAGILNAELEVRSVPGRVPSPGWSLFAFGYRAIAPHFLLDTTKIRTELGFADVIDTQTALTQTVEWAVDNFEIVDRKMGLFIDYEAEDKFTSAYDRSMEELAEVAQVFAEVPIPPR